MLDLNEIERRHKLTQNNPYKEDAFDAYKASSADVPDLIHELCSARAELEHYRDAVEIIKLDGGTALEVFSGPKAWAEDVMTMADAAGVNANSRQGRGDL